MYKTDPRHLKAKHIPVLRKDFGEEIAYNDTKISFAIKYCRGKSVLDLGCVQHNPENFKSKYWLHKALKEVARVLVGLDLSEEGVKYLQSKGFNVILGDAQCFELKRKFDVIVAGDLIEHLEDFHGFFESCKKHLEPNGRIIISTPNIWHWKFIVKAALFGRVNPNPEHTCWFDPQTLQQLAERHDLKMGEVEFGSRYLRDRLVPLPRILKHTSFHAEFLASGD